MLRNNPKSRFQSSGSISGALALVLGLLACALSRPIQAVPATASRLDFNRDIRPILSDHCFACHGPDDAKRKSGLRLDLPSSGTQPLKSGAIAIVPGKPDQSEVIKRIVTQDMDDRMPPPKSGHPLTPVQVELLTRWITEGAEYQSHWAFIRPSRTPLPQVSDPAWPRNGIDHFILSKLEEHRVKPAPEADKQTLIRRASLDLTGLPPTPAEVDAFLADTSDRAYEHLVDRLLSSPHYGEKMAVEWLDAARYADTHGYHIDSGRDMTHWRDWVIKAYNDNKPFDQFTIEQLAGDLLPQPTLDQQIASGFNRNHMINYEGGAIPEEYHAAYLMDRVNTTSTVWLGLTMACAQCHDHKYDPITMKDYYRFYAFFNNIAEKGLDGSQGNAAPVIKVMRPEQKARLQEFDATIQTAEAKLKDIESSLPSEQLAWEKRMVRDVDSPRALPQPRLRLPLDASLSGTRNDQPFSLIGDETGWTPKWADALLGQALEFDGKQTGNLRATESLDLERDQPFSFGAWVKPGAAHTGTLFSKMDSGPRLRGFDLLLSANRLHLHLIHSWPDNALRVVAKTSLPKDSWGHVLATYDGSGKASGVKLFVNGRETAVEVTHDTLTGSIANRAPFLVGKRAEEHPYRGAISDIRIYDRQLSTQEAGELASGVTRQIAQLEPDKRSAHQQQHLAAFYKLYHAPHWVQAKDAVAAAKAEREKFDKSIPDTMVMGELEKPRETFMLMRGEYDKKGEKVEAGTPGALPPLAEGLPSNRLGLAKWLVAPEQPLTARVVVNRFWQAYFGMGLVRSSENFGSQADWPTHPELLDWLATEFVASGWNVKSMQRLIVTSAAYRQRSTVSPEALELDPENKWITRGPRLRLPAESIRDQALAISGLLNPQIGGASVFPYQPPGLWEELMAREDNDRFTAQKYVQSKGPDLYRRSMYTFWKRTSPPSALGTLDAPDRQTCVVRRQRTNTPLQALLLMNDPTYVEASRKFAERLMVEASDPNARINLAYRIALSRLPTDAEKKVLSRLFDEQFQRYRSNRKAAEELLGVGESPTRPGLDPAELAAWTLVTNAILNLDETITKG
ncbi:MAG: DUF1553 domain-containing protein [Verrucomicrobiales bacterium]|nr:DUF1553 domain-containing protein [Verrucomicrobiales bacterium]